MIKNLMGTGCMNNFYIAHEKNWWARNSPTDG